MPVGQPVSSENPAENRGNTAPRAASLCLPRILSLLFPAALFNCSLRFFSSFLPLYHPIPTIFRFSLRLLSFPVFFRLFPSFPYFFQSRAAPPPLPDNRNPPRHFFVNNLQKFSQLFFTIYCVFSAGKIYILCFGLFFLVLRPFFLVFPLLKKEIIFGTLYKHFYRR